MLAAGKQDHHNELLADQVALLYRSATFSNLFNLLIAAVFLTIQAPYLSTVQMGLWSGYTLLALAFRQFSNALYRNDKHKHLHATSWLTRYTFCIVLVAGIWGSAGLFIVPGESVANQVYTTFVIGGMVAGAVTTLSTVLRVYILFALIALVPLAVNMFFYLDRIHLGISLTILIYLAFLIVSARQMHNMIKASLSLRYTRENEENLRQLANNSSDGILVIQDNDIVYMNERMKNLAGEDVFNRIIDLSLSGNNRKHFDLDLPGKDAESTLHFQVRCANTNWYDKPAMLYTVHDVSAELAAKHVEQVSQAKSDFMSQMSHELRTPMNAILGFAQILELPGSGELSQSQRECTREIIDSGHHLLALINDLLDMSRIEANRVVLKPEDIDIVDFVTSVRAMFNEIPDARFHVDNQCPDQACTVRADSVRLRQVLTNLISNAHKYNREGGHITISLECIGAYARITITDEGKGIDDATRKILFTPFERGSAEDTTIAGTGIGLYISRGLVVLMGGEIGVDSTPGEGSSFWFTLPLSTG